MFASIVKSALRDEYTHIINSTIEEDRCYLTREYLANIRQVTTKFRNLRKSSMFRPFMPIHWNISISGMSLSAMLSNNTSINCRFSKPEHPKDYFVLKKSMQELLKDELHYKWDKNYITVNTENKSNNQEFISRAGMLKKYIESDLYLIARKKGTLFCWTNSFQYSSRHVHGFCHDCLLLLPAKIRKFYPTFFHRVSDQLHAERPDQRIDALLLRPQTGFQIL